MLDPNQSKEWLLLQQENMSSSGRARVVSGVTSRASRQIFQRSNTLLSGFYSELALEFSPLLAFSLPGNLTLEEEGVSPLPLTHSYYTSFLLNVKVKSPWWPHWDSRARKAKHVTIWSLDCRSLMLETGWYVDFWMGYQDLSLWNCRHVRLVSTGQWFRVSST